jgi:hypothetical protein
MKIAEILSTTRHSIKEHSDDSRYTDSFLWSLFKGYRSRLLGQKENLSRWNYQTFCVDMKEDTFDCTCDVTCKVYKSETVIPKAISFRGIDKLEVTTLDGTVIPFKHENQVKTDQLDPIKKGKPSYTVFNQTIILFNAKYKQIRITGVFEDPTEKVFCDNCDSIFDIELGLDEDIAQICNEMVRNFILNNNMPEEQRLDLNPNTKE